MGYLIRHDYLKQIQDGHLDEISEADSSVLVSSELAAIEEVTSYLSQKYLIDREFSMTSAWSPTVEYSAADRVYFNADAYDEDTGTYALNSLTLYGGNVYICTTAVVSAEPFDDAKWELLGQQYEIAYVAYPQPLFDINKPYLRGDKVFWENKIYTALHDTNTFTQNDALQYGRYSAIPPFNVIPGSSPSGSLFWSEDGDYSIDAGTMPTVDNGWTIADNRNQQILTYTIDISLYHLFSRIAPMNIPQLRFERYHEAREWLRSANKGVITARLEKVAPDRGYSVRYGGNARTLNSY